MTSEKPKLLLMACLLLLASSCETVPEVPRGALTADSVNKCRAGVMCVDLEERFQVPCPVSQAVMKNERRGMGFTYDRMLSWNVFVYDPATEPEALIAGLRDDRMRHGNFINVAGDESFHYRSLPSRDIYFTIKSKDGRILSTHYTRFVKTPEHLFWLQYNILTARERRQSDLDGALDFFDSVRFKGEFSKKS